MGGIQQDTNKPAQINDNKELQAKIKKFLDLLYRYDCIGKDAYYKKEKDFYKFGREHYCMIMGRKYIWIDAPYLRFACTNDGLLFWPKKYWTCGDRCFGHIDSLLDGKRWGKNIKRVHSRARRGLGYPGEWANIDYHHLVVGNLGKCICGRTANVKDTVVGPRCQYCRASDVRHMNSLRQLGGVPTAHGKPITTNENYYRA